MSIVNKYNYEAFLLDFAEGQLSAEQTNALFDFLAAHPELKEDFDAVLEMQTLQGEGIVFKGKESLLQDEALEAKQDLIIAHLEKEQTEVEKSTFEEMLKSDEALARETQIFAKMKLEVDENLVFSKQEDLIQTVPISYASWIYRTSFAAAAVILLLLAINTMNSGLEISGDALAKNKLPDFEVPKKPVSGSDWIQELPIQNNPIEAEIEQGTTQPTWVNEQYAAVDQIKLMPLSDTREIALRDASEMGELAEMQDMNYALPTNEEEYASFIERVSYESNAFNVAYGFADAMTSKIKTAKKEFGEYEYIEIKFWKVHTQIRKPSWIKLNRR